MKLSDPMACVEGAPPDVRAAVRSAVLRRERGCPPTKEEQDVVFGWLRTQQQQDRYGKPKGIQ